MAVKANPALAMLISTQPGMRTSIGAAMKAKRAGMPRGFPDMMLCVIKPRLDKPYDKWRDPLNYWAGLFIELKRVGAPPSAVKPEQRWWGEQLIRQGYCHRVCFGAKEAISVIEKYLDGEL